MSKKINLNEFENEKLEVTNKMNTKGGSGSTSSKRSGTICTGNDMDTRSFDKDA